MPQDSSTYLNLQGCVECGEDTSSLLFYDVTNQQGNCDEGYGTTGNLVPLTDVLESEIIITDDGSSWGMAYVIDTSAVLPNTDLTPFTIESSDVGNNSFTDGVYEIWYNVTVDNNGTEQVWTWHRKIFLTCEVSCKLKTLIGKIPEKGDCCDCKAPYLEQLAKAKALYDAMMSAVCCGNEAKAKKILKLLQKLLINVNCNC